MTERAVLNREFRPLGLTLQTSFTQQLERIYMDRYDEFTRVSTAITGDSDLARDCVHDAFVSAIRNATKYRQEGALDAWVWRIVVNTSLRYRRRGARDQVISETEADVAAIGPGELAAQVRAAVARLSERQRLVVFLRYYADLDYATISETLQITTGTVGATLSAAHAALRLRLEEVRTK